MSNTQMQIYPRNGSGCHEDEYQTQSATFQYPVTSDMQIACGYAKLARLERRRNNLCNDPMSESYPIGDFMEDFDREERQILADILYRARTIGDEAAKEFCNVAFEKWMP